MKHTLRFLCVLSLIALVFTVRAVQKDLPAEDDTRIQDRYSGWNGVIEVWVSSDCPSGAVRWIESCATSFDRAHDGVFIYTTLVSPEIIAQRRTNGARQPDAIVFLPCSFEDRGDLRDLSSVWDSADIRTGLRGIDRRCIPVAMGAYALAYGADKSEQATANLTGVCYPDSKTRVWSAALLCLLDAPDPIESDPTEPPSGSGLDLGLTAAAAGSAEETPVFPGHGFSFTDSAIADFVAGKADAIVVTQREISRLNSLAATPDFQIRLPNGVMPADQLLLYAVIQSDRADGAAREELAMEFSAHLLAERSQAALPLLRSFPVLAGSGIYGTDLLMGSIESALDRLRLATPDVFAPYWHDAASLLYGKCAAGEITVRDAMERLLSAP